MVFCNVLFLVQYSAALPTKVQKIMSFVDLVPLFRRLGCEILEKQIHLVKVDLFEVSLRIFFYISNTPSPYCFLYKHSIVDFLVFQFYYWFVDWCNSSLLSHCFSSFKWRSFKLQSN